MKSFHLVTKALGGTRLPLECDLLKIGQRQKNASLTRSTHPWRFLPRPLSPRSVPKYSTVWVRSQGCFGVQAEAALYGGPRVSQFRSLRIDSALTVHLAPRWALEAGGGRRAQW